MGQYGSQIAPQAAKERRSESSGQTYIIKPPVAMFIFEYVLI